VRARHIAVVAPVIAVLVALPTAAIAAPVAPRAYAAAIEGYAPYQPQTTCVATAQPGVAAWRDQLLRTYTFSRSLGIVRGCNVGGRSEHKEGRALDWGVNVTNAREATAANEVLAWLLATDKYGNKHAMARRLGIQYIIWNRRIWGSYNASQGWRAYTGASPHTDHVHFSFSWAGAKKTTSYWDGTVANVGGTAGGTTGGTGGDTNVMPDDDAVGEPIPPATLKQASALNADSVYLDARKPLGAYTLHALQKGVPYLVEVKGTYQYKNGARADAECSNSAGAPGTWARTRSLSTRPRDADHLDVYLNGIDGRFQSDDDSECDANHTYRWTYVPERTGRANFRVWDSTFTDNAGGLNVRVVKLHTDDADRSFTVPASSPVGGTGGARYREGVSYVVQVTGTWTPSATGKADGRCVYRSGAWHAQRTDGSDYDTVLLNGNENRAWPLVDTGGGCDATTHTYRFGWKPWRDTTLSVKVNDTGYTNNTGSLTVRVVRSDLAGRLPVAPVAPKPPQPPAPAPETIAVDSRDADGVLTAQSYTAGVAYVVTAKGTYDAGAGITADAECSAATSDPAWRTRRDSTLSDRSLWDVTVNGRTRDWVAVGGVDGCSGTHEYTFTYTPGQTGRLHLGVRDVTFGDNAGSLAVSIKRA
jgi:hypothetical protein